MTERKRERERQKERNHITDWEKLKRRETERGTRETDGEKREKGRGRDK